MFGRLWYYLTYAARNLRRSARWTAFAVFCIATGVAAVVALRTLGLAIGDSLIENVRIQNHGDINLGFQSGGGGFAFGGRGVGSDQNTFSPAVLDRVEAWARENDAVVSAYTQVSTAQVTAIDAVSVGRPQFVSLFLIDPATFPTTGPVNLIEPAGAALENVLTGDNSIVISRNLADQQGLSVGDTVRVSGTQQPFTVTGIAPTEAEAGTSNLFAAFFGFAYVPLAQAEALQLPADPNVITVALPVGTDGGTIVEAAEQLRRLTGAPYAATTTELLSRNQQVSDILGRFIVVMGLGALLIGGVGIINTMLVMVGRRTNEIAALKTFGLNGRQIAAMFLAEAFLLGILGSLAGIALGMILSIFVNQYGEAFLQQRLPLRLYPEAILFGGALGIVVTLVFGLLPILTANRVRPATILRPNETVVPAAGCFAQVLVLLLVIIVIGGIAGQILGNVVIGMVGVAVTLLLLGLLVGFMWLVVWVVSRLPAFGIPDLRLALRNLTSRRVRTATTLLALAAGMFALSSITFVGAGTRELLNIQLAQNFGGNVLVFPLLSMLSPELAQAALNQQIASLEGVSYSTVTNTYSAGLVLVDGQSPPDLGFTEFTDELPRGRMLNNLQLQERISTNPNPLPVDVKAGRTLTPDDVGQRVMLVSDDAVTQSRGITLGSRLTVQIDDQMTDFEVVGILASSGGLFGGFGQYLIPEGSIDGRPSFSLTTLQVAPENLNQVLLDLSVNPLLIALDIGFIDGLVGRLINQFAAIPTVVGLLSLLAAAVAMANTVALATLERRRQIGILKAVGLRSRRVLWIMLLENSFIGLLGGLLGVGLSALGLSIVSSLSNGSPIPLPADAVMVGILLIVAALGIAWVATFLSAQPVTRERVTNVLRYE
jgi:predicted lysophospholipase L1 biosynthesis ABC-type transport system permease subunit